MFNILHQIIPAPAYLEEMFCMSEAWELTFSQFLWKIYHPWDLYHKLYHKDHIEQVLLHVL